MRQAPCVSVDEAIAGSGIERTGSVPRRLLVRVGASVGKSYGIFVIGIVVAVAGVVQIRFASLGPDWLPDESRRAYVEGQVLTGAVALWAVVTLLAGLIARVAIPALLTVVAAVVIFATRFGPADKELVRPLFDAEGPGAFLGDLGQLLFGPLLLAPLIGALAIRDLWRLIAWVVGRVPRPFRVAVAKVAIPVLALVASDVAYAVHMREKIVDSTIAVQLPGTDSEWQVVQGSLQMTAWAEYDVVEYRIQRGGVIWDVFLFPEDRAGFRLSGDMARDDGSNAAEIFMEMEPGTPGELVRANCWACPD